MPTGVQEVERAVGVPHTRDEAIRLVVVRVRTCGKKSLSTYPTPRIVGEMFPSTRRARRVLRTEKSVSLVWAMGLFSSGNAPNGVFVSEEAFLDR